MRGSRACSFPKVDAHRARPGIGGSPGVLGEEKSNDKGWRKHVFYSPTTTSNMASGAFCSSNRSPLPFSHQDGKGGPPGETLPTEYSAAPTRPSVTPGGLSQKRQAKEMGLGSLPMGTRGGLCHSGVPTIPADLLGWGRGSRISTKMIPPSTRGASRKTLPQQ